MLVEFRLNQRRNHGNVQQMQFGVRVVLADHPERRQSDKRIPDSGNMVNQNFSLHRFPLLFLRYIRTDDKVADQ